MLAACETLANNPHEITRAGLILPSPKMTENTISQSHNNKLQPATRAGLRRFAAVREDLEAPLFG